MAAPWKYDPVATRFFERVELSLRHGPINADLRERVRAALQRAHDENNTLLTTVKRITWCVHFSTFCLLQRLDSQNTLRVESLREDRPPLRSLPIMTLVKLNELETALRQVEESVNSDQAELKMVGGEVMRGTGQMRNKHLDTLKHACTSLHELFSYARTYLQGIQSAATTVGTAFHNFLVDLGIPRDDLIVIGEELVGVQA